MASLSLLERKLEEATTLENAVTVLLQWYEGNNIVFFRKFVEKLPSYITAYKIPSGGATGQVLTKLSTSDGDIDWVDSTGGDAQSTPFSPSGNIGSTNVQAAIEELDSEKAASIHTHSHTDITDYDTELAGTNNITPFTPVADYHPATKKYVDDSLIGGGGYTDEQAQDAVGAMVSSEFTYTDATPLLEINSIDADKIDDSTSINKFATAGELSTIAANAAAIASYGTAATNNTSDFATAAQGVLADSALQNVVEDTTPQLGGNLDAQNNSIQNLSDVEADTITADSSAGLALRNSAGTAVLTIGAGVGTGATFANGVNTGALGVTGNITVSGTVDGRDVSADGTKLDGIEAGAQVNEVTLAGTETLTNKTIAYGSNTISGLPCEIQVACSDLTTALTTGTTKAYFRMPYAMTLTGVRASLLTAGSTSGTTTIDINESGTTILGTKLTIDAGEKTSTTAATAAVISDSALADDAEISIDIDAISGGATEAGLIVTLIGTRV